MPETRRTLNHLLGCLAGGAAGDALGAPVEGFQEMMAQMAGD